MITLKFLLVEKNQNVTIASAIFQLLKKLRTEVLLILGLCTRISAGALAIVMIVAIISAKVSLIDSLQTLLGFDEAIYFAVFTWLAIAGAGKASLDYLLEKKYFDKS